MRQEEFENRYQSQWQAFEEQINEAEKFNSLRSRTSLKLKGFAQAYRQLCYSLAIARQRQYSPNLISRLDALVFRGHQVFYQKRLPIFSQIYQFIIAGFAIKTRQHWKPVTIALLLFYLPTLITFALTIVFPDFIYNIVEPEQVARIEDMYRTDAETFGRERASDTDFMMFGHYIKNNIGIAFQTFAGGIVASLGSQFFLIFNGLLFGALSAHMLNIGYTSTFFSFVCGHAAFELTGIVISGAAGLMIGWAIIAPGNYSRKQALVNAAREAIQLVYGAIILLLAAAFVEAFWSSSSSVSVQTKYTVAAVLWGIVISYFLLAGRRFGISLSAGARHGS